MTKSQHPEAIILSSIIALIALSAMIGWLLNIHFLVQINHDYVPMQFNTALGFALLGISLLCTQSLKHITYACSILALSNASIVLFEYTFGVHFAIDNLFVQHSVTTYTAYSGRMSPNTALCQLTFSAALLAHMTTPRFKWLYPISCIMLLSVGLLGTSSLLGYLLNLKAFYGWGNISGMAVHTALCFMLLSIGGYRIFFWSYRNEPLFTSAKLPIYTFSVGIVVLLITFQSLLNYQDNNIRRVIEKDTSFVADHLETSLSKRITPIESLFYRIQKLHIAHPRIVREDINKFIQHNPDVLAIAYQSPSLKQQLFMGSDISEASTRMQLNNCTKAITHLTPSPHKVSILPVDHLLCVYQKNLSSMALVDLSAIMENIFKHQTLSIYGASLSSNNESFFEKKINAPAAFKSLWSEQQTFTLFHKKWQLTLWISPAIRAHLSDHTPYLYIFYVLVVIALLSSAIRLWQLSSIKNQVITEAKDQVEHLAFHDHLTDLYNRMQYEQLLKKAIARSERTNTPIGIALLDLDNFKNVNDTMGHDMGDQLLKEIAKRVTNSIRENDIFARFGGDEFAFIFDPFNEKEATALAHNILATFHQPFCVDRTPLNITASIGIAAFPKDALCLETLIKAADLALYKAKKSGKDSVQIASELC